MKFPGNWSVDRKVHSEDRDTIPWKRVHDEFTRS
jgi:hypothetical protein